MVPGESRLYNQRYLRRPFAVRAYRAHWWLVIHVGELASYTRAHVSFNAGRLCRDGRSEEHTSELQSQSNLVCRLLLEKKKKTFIDTDITRRVRMYSYVASACAMRAR